MKSILTLILSVLLLCSACSSRKKPHAGSNKAYDSSSYEKAIVINEKHEMQGIHAEYAWIKEHYPAYRTKSQALMMHNKRAYDRLHIVSETGDEKDIYFDITEFYGK